MPPVELVDFTSYDLGRLLEALQLNRDDLGPDAYGVHLLRAAAQRHLPWDHRLRRCWDDPSFTARYTWLRGRLVPADAGHDYPLGALTDALAALVNERMALDPDEPF